MNKIITTLALLLTLSVSAQKFNNGVEYMSYIGETYSQLSDDSWDYIRAAAHSNRARKIDKRRQELISSLTNAKKKISKLSGYNGNTAYKESIVNYLNIDYQIMTEDYAKIVDMEEVAQQSYDNMEAYMLAKQLANDKLDEASKKVQVEQQKFADDNNITLNDGDTKRAEKLEKANAVYEHYNDVFLIFFKSNKQELYFIEALSEQDVNAMNQNLNALKSILAEDKKKLSAVKLYEGDKSLVGATREVFNFYDEEVNKKFPVLMKFFEAKDRFDKVKGEFDKIKENKRTQADVDKYNSSLSEYQKHANNYNSINDDLNKRRAQVIENWNKTADRFTNKHVPRGK